MRGLILVAILAAIVPAATVAASAELACKPDSLLVARPNLHGEAN